MASFISATACSMGMTPLRVKKEACRIVLVRFPSPSLRAMAMASMV